MDKSHIIDLIAQHRLDLSKLGVCSLALFGSVARGEAGPNSDIDILVNFQGSVTFDQYMETKFLLEDLLGCRVDLVIEQALRPQVRPFVEEDAIYVA